MNKTLNTLVVSILAAAFSIAPVSAAPTDSAPPSPTASSVARNSITDQDIQLMREDIRQKRRQLVAANLPLTTEESAKFWPVYDQYIAEVAKIYDGRFERLKTYAANYQTMTDEQAAEHVSKLLDSDKTMIDVRRNYIKTFEKAVSKKKVASFVQMDRRIQMMIDIQIAGLIPLINPK